LCAKERMERAQMARDTARRRTEEARGTWFEAFCRSKWCWCAAGQVLQRGGERFRLVSAVKTQPSSRLVATCLKWFEERTGCAIMRALADDVLRAIKKSPHAALTEANKWRDPRYFAGHGRAGGGLVSLARGGGQDAHGAHTLAR